MSAFAYFKFLYKWERKSHSAPVAFLIAARDALRHAPF